MHAAACLHHSASSSTTWLLFPPHRLSNLNGVGVARTIGNKTYYLHRGISTDYYNTVRAPLMDQLKRITANQQLRGSARTITFAGQQAGGEWGVSGCLLVAGHLAQVQILLTLACVHATLACSGGCASTHPLSHFALPRPLERRRHGSARGG